MGLITKHTDKERTKTNAQIKLKMMKLATGEIQSTKISNLELTMLKGAVGGQTATAIEDERLKQQAQNSKFYVHTRMPSYMRERIEKEKAEQERQRRTKLEPMPEVEEVGSPSPDPQIAEMVAEVEQKSRLSDPNLVAEPKYIDTFQIIEKPNSDGNTKNNSGIIKSMHPQLLGYKDTSQDRDTDKKVSF